MPSSSTGPEDATAAAPGHITTSHTRQANTSKENQRNRRRAPRNQRGATKRLEAQNGAVRDGAPATESSVQHRPWKKQPRRPKVPQDERNANPQDEPFSHSGRSSPTGALKVQQERRERKQDRDVDNPARGSAPTRGGRRKRQINAKLTSGDMENTSETTSAAAPVRRRRDEARPDTLANRLTDSLRKPPYADCPICFNAIHPAQPIWSCSPFGPSKSASSEDADESEEAPGDMQCCYTPFHLKCIKSWASKSVKDMRDAYLARGETGRQGEWRCPGCQRKRLHVPSSYVCFCGSTPDPHPQRLATPHSCGNPCSRPRACNHACSLSCHPGPCPPCQVTMQLPCYCGRQIKSFRCSELPLTQASNRAIKTGSALSCGNKCNKYLGCGKHQCAMLCHSGDCDECLIVEEVRCYCGKTTRSLKCGQGDVKHSCVLNDEGVLEEWDGKFACEYTCGRPFDCNIHKCERLCHPPSTSPPPCPRSPLIVSHCPCGKKPLQELEGGARQKCTDPIVTCGNMCMKELEGCEHVCSIPCHSGLCPPCGISLIIPCRCGSTTRAIKCHERKTINSQEILCDKPCTALRACGRHRCNRQCCPLAALAGGTKGRGKKSQAFSSQYALGDEARWHECDLICGKPLGCGNHHCEERDHRGACPPCLRSSFDEMVCHCGRTVLEPPIPCGTRISCSYQCSRPSPLCGHPRTQHMCHEDPTPCPPCPFLKTRTCACGKNQVKNIRCSQEKVSCGTACDKLLDCGFHHCERICHGGNCGTCKSICGKPRKLCLPAQHGCTALCHAPAACSEDEPCQAVVMLCCPCGRLQQPSVCGRSAANPAGRGATQQLKCNNDCAIAKRNARLAEALGISQEVQERDGQRPVTYSSELIAFAHANAKFCAVVEKTFADFINSERKAQLLPHMHEARRKFVQELAVVYRLDTQLIDREPMRSVQIIRRVDTRIPRPLLSSQTTPALNLGKLTGSRSTPLAPIPRPSSATPPPATQHAKQGWTSVVSANPGFTTNVGSASTPPSRGAPDASSQVAGARVNAAVHSRSGTAEPPAAQRLGEAIAVAHMAGTQQPNDAVPEDWENDE